MFSLNIAPVIVPNMHIVKVQETSMCKKCQGVKFNGFMVISSLGKMRLEWLNAISSLFNQSIDITKFRFSFLMELNLYVL